jgi:hypothetical protein
MGTATPDDSAQAQDSSSINEDELAEFIVDVHVLAMAENWENEIIRNYLG